MNNLFAKTHKAIKEGGVKTLAERTHRYIQEKVFGVPPITEEDVRRQQEALEREARRDTLEAAFLKEEERKANYKPMVDVLFINGCGELVPHPSRYRVTHQREQLNACNIVSEEVFYTELKIEQVKLAHVFIFFRCPYTETIGEFINLAKKLNKVVLFDVDDLVIDTKYTDQVKYVKQLTGDERSLYDDGVNRMGQTLKMCDGAITSTNALAQELSNYVPEVFINRNTASERMYELSEKVVSDRDDKEVRLGYFSGSITHNDDFQLILPTIKSILSKYNNTRLYIVGELDIPSDLEEVKGQIVVSPFVDWEELPQLISSVDINLAPLEDTIFNRAKSENKWVEAALVKVPTVASNVGAFSDMMISHETGILCSDEDEWEKELEKLIEDSEYRQSIAENAYRYVKDNCLSIYTAHKLGKFISEKMKKTAVLLLPSTEISGGIMVALKHMTVFYKNGYDVTIIADRPSLDYMEFEGCVFPVLSNGQNDIYAHYKKAIATMWTTTPFLETYPKLEDRYYLVQGYEIDLYEPNIILRIQASQTYFMNKDIRYLTVSKWCQSWLLDKFEKKAEYIPNGLELDRFEVTERDFTGKIRVLIEGDCAVDYKRVDESFEIANKLDRNKYEVWYMSYNETPKAWYQYDKFLHRVPYEKVPEVYQQCHILLKSSELESFSYPPLEMMATGGYVVVAPNGGNSEYIKDGYNCLTYDHDVIDAIHKIHNLVSDSNLRDKLKNGAIETAKNRDWKQIEQSIKTLYGIDDE